MTHLAQCTSLLSLWRPIDEPRSTTLAQQRETPPVAAFTVFLEVLFHQFPPYINILCTSLYYVQLHIITSTFYKCRLQKVTAHTIMHTIILVQTPGWLHLVKQSYAAFLSLPKHAASTPNSEHTIHTLGNSKPKERPSKDQEEAGEASCAYTTRPYHTSHFAY